MSENDKKLVRVRMKDHIVGRPSYHAGEIADLEPRIANAWINEGICVPVTDEPKPERRASA
jgi:hypothetical protein